MLFRRRESKLNEDSWLVAVLEEYNSLRQEALEAIGVQHAILRFGIAGLVVLVGFGTRYTGTDLQLSLAILNLLTPAGAFATLILWQGEVERMVRASTFVAHLSQKVNSRMASRQPALEWELFLRRPKGLATRRIISEYGPIAFILVSLPIAASAIGLRGFWQDHRARPPTGDSMHEMFHEGFPFWFAAFAAWDTLAVVVLIGYYIRKSRQIREIAKGIGNPSAN
jgi:hypothetical protein